MMRVLLFLSFALPAHAAEPPSVPTEVSTGVFFYTDDPAKKVRASLEIAEDGLVFETQRDPRDVARDEADEEIRQGNVCLRQARADLKTAVKKFRVRSMCGEIYAEELPALIEKASRTKLHPDVFRCYAEAEAHEKSGFVSVSLVFRGQLATHSPVPKKFQRAGFPDEPVDWALPTHTITARSQWGWKGALKEGACTFDKASLDRFEDKFLLERSRSAELVKCEDEQTRALDQLARMQAQFRAYVPDDWIPAGEKSQLLETPETSMTSLEDCKATRAAVLDRLKALRAAGGKLADEYGVTALREAPPAAASDRAPASVADDGEE